MKRKLVAAIACRNQGSRLYGKPLQNLDIQTGTRILDNIIECLRSLECIDEIVLGVSEGPDNEAYRYFANEKQLSYIIGDEIDVLDRLIQCGEVSEATDIFRVTSESPFLYFQPVCELWEKHKKANLDATFLDDIVDGCGFEIISMEALRSSHSHGEAKHRSELCSLYIRENKNDFKVHIEMPPQKLIRKDLRLTVDNPEDLVVCRHLYSKFRNDAPRFNIEKLIAFLDEDQTLKNLVAPYTEAGYSLMYK